MSTTPRPRTGADCAFFEAFTSQPKDVKAGFDAVMSFHQRATVSDHQ
jgi:hypothetical protein